MRAALAATLKTRAAHLALAIDQPDTDDVDDYYLGRAVADLTGSALYRTNDFKTARKPPRAALQRVSVAGLSSAAQTAARRGLTHGEAIAAGQSLLRDLGNLPGNVCTPRYLAQQARELAKDHRSLKVRVFDEPQIRRLKMGSLLSVSRGSAEPPRFIAMEYRGGARDAAPVVLVGKGVTFDTGGISLKDPAAMDEMKYDMCGAGSVLASMLGRLAAQAAHQSRGSGCSGREHAWQPRHQARRHRHQRRRQDHRDSQHGCRRPVDSLRCARLCAPLRARCGGRTSPR